MERQPVTIRLYKDDPLDFCYECPACGSINIDGHKPEVCPDCDTPLAYPEVYWEN